MQNMIREIAETLPVAAVMALVVAFGLKTGRSSALRETAPGHITMQSVTGLQSTLRGRQAVIAGEESARADAKPPSESCGQETSGDEITRRDRFIERVPDSVKDGVPFFTVRDLEPRGTPGRATGGNGKNPSNGGAISTPDRLSINDATADELETIPGIGSHRAGILVSNRPRDGYRNWDEIDRLPGFGRGTIEMLKLNAVLE